MGLSFLDGSWQVVFVFYFWVYINWKQKIFYVKFKFNIIVKFDGIFKLFVVLMVVQVEVIDF